MKLKDQVAIITGAGAGIGGASASLFAREGARVAVVDLNQKAADETSSVITSNGGTCRVFAVDVSRSSDVQRLVDGVIKLWGRIDILFNNAGIVPHGKIHQTTEEEWDRAMAVNVKSMYLTCHAVIPIFKQQGGGTIINTSSATVLRNVVDRAAYTASKGAVLALSRSMAMDYVGENIRVNAICPGTIDTPSLRARLAAHADPKEARKRFIARQPMGRLGTAEEVAQAALYLASSEAAFVTGTALSIDGGFTL
ncbi:MAG TPA: SDR family oxidoreductase [Terriglobales bacterium]|nr:SDR family oxidoreductase [Terriglobales bacterium]